MAFGSDCSLYCQSVFVAADPTSFRPYGALDWPTEVGRLPSERGVRQPQRPQRPPRFSVHRRAATDRLGSNQEPSVAHAAAVELGPTVHHRCHVTVATTVYLHPSSSGQSLASVMPPRRLPSVSTRSSCAIFASSAFSRLRMVSRSWRATRSAPRQAIRQPPTLHRLGHPHLASGRLLDGDGDASMSAFTIPRIYTYLTDATGL
jgi:hypothetical protein